MPADQVRVAAPVLSSAQELIYDANTAIDSSVNAASLGSDSRPAHSPRRPKQTCIDKDTGTVHEWWGGSWK